MPARLLADMLLLRARRMSRTRGVSPAESITERNENDVYFGTAISGTDGRSPFNVFRRNLLARSPGKPLGPIQLLGGKHEAGKAAKGEPACLRSG